MKLHSLLTVLVLGMAVFVQGQTSTDPQPITPIGGSVGKTGSGASAGGKPVVGDDLNLANRMDVLILKAGLLTEVVEQVERYFKDDPKKPDVELPNLVYAKDTRDAVVPGDLTLRRVTPVQALALVVAAADCTFRPIFAPDEKAGQKTMIIGYRIEPQAVSGSGKASDGRLMNTPGSSFGAARASSGSSGPDGGGSFAVEVPTGVKPGAVSHRVSSPQSARGNEPFVRVYAIGFIMTGTDEEKGTKMKAVDELIRQALNQAKLDLNPDLNIHLRTGTLISKATAAQHEIIEQAVQAMKENAPLLAAPAKP